MPTKTNAAVLWGPQQDWKVEQITIDDPGPGEIRVRTAVAECATRTSTWCRAT